MLLIGRRSGAEQLLHGVGEFLPLVGPSGRLPASEQRAGGNHRSLLAAVVGLGVEVPDAGVAEAVGVRIAGQHVGRHVAGQVPLAAVLAGARQTKSTSVRSQA